MSPARSTFVREDLFFLAELAGEAGRHEDVIKQIKLIIDHFSPQLTTEERSLLSVAYKTTTNALRNSWRVIDALYKLQSTRKAPLHLIQRQRDRIESELTGVCRDVIRLLDRELLPAATEGEETVFYSKLKGDYCRYLAEVGQKRDRERFAELSLKAYRSAYKHAQATLHPLHPTRLGLALNFAVYYHDIKTSPERACHLAKNAFDNAVLSVDASDPGLDQILRDSMAILQLLRDDLILWSGEMKDSDEA
ncbi:putative 14-3-3 family protein [Lyophyllum shimeji]|uniref:14-3-3 family protein n=1 Tax=Lyophyllum shimeji TaxID=47721 RepID=A0A9P3UHD9_LYOSH|nr:putative 14-3-3 family protein [Lyophyllum shimeji]